MPATAPAEADALGRPPDDTVQCKPEKVELP